MWSASSGSTRTFTRSRTREPIALREYRTLRDLRRINIPAVSAVGVVSGRATPDGEVIEPVLVTRHLRNSMPYREMFSRGVRPDTLPKLVDALVVLLTRLHLGGFYWGDCSLSNTLFRRAAGEFSAYLVDAETGELHELLSDGQRNHDLDTATGNLFGETLDLQAGGFMTEDIDAFALIEGLQQRYDDLWSELTGVEDFPTDEMWRIEQRMTHSPTRLPVCGLRTPLVWRRSVTLVGMTNTTTRTPVLDLIILDCPDALELATF